MADFDLTSPDGRKFRVTAPAGASQEQVLSYAKSQWDRRAKPAAEKAPDPSEGGLPFRPFGIDTGMTMPQGVSRFAAGVGSGLTDLATGVGQRFGMVDQASVDEKKNLDAPLMDTGAGMAGNITGKVAGTAPAMFIPGANTLVGAGAIGAGLGAMEPTKTGESVGMNMALGGLGGAGGQMAGQALGRFVKPVQNQLDQVEQGLVKSAQGKGIPLDAADLTGSRPLKTMRDVMGQLPLTADRQAAVQGTKQAAFNKAVSGTFGSSEEAITPNVLQAARGRIGQQFTDLSSRNAANIDNSAMGKLSSVIDEANRYSTPDVAKIVSNYTDDILSRVDANGQIPGKAYRALDSQMGKALRSSSSGDVRNAVGQLRDTLREAMDASISQADQAGWKEARSQYANLMKVAPLAAKSETGDVSGRALLGAALRGSKSSAFSGGGDLGELGRIGKAFVAEQTPNSGTAQRLFMQRFLENPLSAFWSQGVGGISLPVQKMMNSKAGQKYLSEGLLPVTENHKALANALTRSGGTALPLAYTEQ